MRITFANCANSRWIGKTLLPVLNRTHCFAGTGIRSTAAVVFSDKLMNADKSRNSHFTLSEIVSYIFSNPHRLAAGNGDAMPGLPSEVFLLWPRVLSSPFLTR